MNLKMLEIQVSDESQNLISELDNLNQRFSSLPPEEILKYSNLISEFRKKSSSTIQNKNDSKWEEANKYIVEKINNNVFPSWSDICNINKILVPEGSGKIRTIEVYIGNHPTSHPNELQDLIAIYRNNVLSESQNQHPLIWATRVRYWLVTIHPFLDGNGRTSNLICDWILALHGYLPLTFNLKVDSLIGGWEGRAHFSSLDYACIKTFNSIKNTYELLKI